MHKCIGIVIVIYEYLYNDIAQDGQVPEDAPRTQRPRVRGAFQQRRLPHRELQLRWSLQDLGHCLRWARLTYIQFRRVVSCFCITRSMFENPDRR